MTINAVVIGVGIMTETGTGTGTTTAENDIIETAIVNGAGIGIGTTMVLGPGYVSGGQRARAKIPRAIVMTETGGRSGGVKIVGGRMAGVAIGTRSVTGMAIGNERGDTIASVGQVGMVGAHEVLNIKEGTHDNILRAALTSSCV